MQPAKLQPLGHLHSSSARETPVLRPCKSHSAGFSWLQKTYSSFCAVQRVLVVPAGRRGGCLGPRGRGSVQTQGCGGVSDVPGPARNAGCGGAHPRGRTLAAGGKTRERHRADAAFQKLGQRRSHSLPRNQQERHSVGTMVTQWLLKMRSCGCNVLPLGPKEGRS